MISYINPCFPPSSIETLLSLFQKRQHWGPSTPLCWQGHAEPENKGEALLRGSSEHQAVPQRPEPAQRGLMAEHLWLLASQSPSAAPHRRLPTRAHPLGSSPLGVCPRQAAEKRAASRRNTAKDCGTAPHTAPTGRRGPFPPHTAPEGKSHSPLTPTLKGRVIPASHRP